MRAGHVVDGKTGPMPLQCRSSAWQPTPRSLQGKPQTAKRLMDDSTDNRVLIGSSDLSASRSHRDVLAYLFVGVVAVLAAIAMTLLPE